MNPTTKKIGLGAALVGVPIGTFYAYQVLKQSTDRQNNAEEEGSAYDLKGLSKIDPALIKYHQAGELATGMTTPRAISIDSQGRVLVAGDHMVRILNTAGETLAKINLADSPTCITSNTQAAIFVGFKDHIEVYNLAGQRQGVWNSFGEKSLLTGLTVIGQDIFVADAGRRVVIRCSFDGKILAELGKGDGTPTTGLVLPSPYLNVTPTADGQLIVNNPGRHRVETYSPDGQLQHFFGQSGTAIAAFIGCCNPSHLAIMPDGRIVTAEKGIPRIKIFQPDGQLDCVVAGPETFGISTRGFELAVDSSNRVLVLEPGKTDIRIFAPNDTKQASAQ